MAPPQHGRVRTRDPAMPYLPSYLQKGQKCVVCGDEATGLHYRAITCEGCKGFFRRVFQKGQRFECKEARKCAIGKDTRNGCQQCRLDKCLAAGMDPQLVLGEKQRVAKKSLIERNRVRKFLEKVQQQLRRALSGTLSPEWRIESECPLPLSVCADGTEGARLRAVVRKCARAYGAELDTPLGLAGQEQFEAAGAEAQQAMFWAHVLRRVIGFAEACGVAEQQQLLCTLDWLSLGVFRLLQPCAFAEHPLFWGGQDPAEGSLLGDSALGGERLSPPSGTGLPAELAAQLQWRALAFHSLQMTNEQIGLCAAYVLFKPAAEQSAQSRQLCADLLSALRLATAENAATGDSVDRRLLQWPLLVAKLADLQSFVGQNRGPLLAKENARALAKMFS